MTKIVDFVKDMYPIQCKYNIVSLNTQWHSDAALIKLLCDSMSDGSCENALVVCDDSVNARHYLDSHCLNGNVDIINYDACDYGVVFKQYTYVICLHCDLVNLQYAMKYISDIMATNIFISSYEYCDIIEFALKSMIVGSDVYVYRDAVLCNNIVDTDNTPIPDAVIDENHNEQYVSDDKEYRALVSHSGHRQVKSENRKNKNGEVFTPDNIVSDMLDLIPCSFDDVNTTFMEPCCGNGAFLVQIVDRKIRACVNNSDTLGDDFANWLLLCVSSTYGIDYSMDNVVEARARVAALFNDVIREYHIADAYKSYILDIINLNIQQGNSITGKDNDGKDIMIYEWAYTDRHLCYTTHRYSDIVSGIDRVISNGVLI